MIRAWALCVVLLWPSLGWAALTFNESNTGLNDTPGGPTVALPTLNVASGSLVVACLGWSTSSTLTSITGTDTMTLLTPQVHTAGVPHAQCGYKLSATANASYAETATFSDWPTYVRMGIMEFTYTGTASFDVEVGSTEDDSDATPSSNTLSTTGSDEVCVTIHTDYNTQTFSNETINGGAYAGRVTQLDFDMFYKIFTAAFSSGASSLTRSSTGIKWVQRLSCFKTDAAASGTLRMMLMGVGK